MIWLSSLVDAILALQWGHLSKRGSVGLAINVHLTEAVNTVGVTIFIDGADIKAKEK